MALWCRLGSLKDASPVESPDLPVDRDCWSLAASGAVGAELRSGCSRPSGFRESGTPWSNYRAAIVERWPQSGFNLLSCLSPEGRGAGSSLECGGQGLPRPSQAPCGEGIRKGGLLTQDPTQSVSWGHASGHVAAMALDSAYLSQCQAGRSSA